MPSPPPPPPPPPAAGRTLYPVTPVGASFVAAYDDAQVYLTWQPPGAGPAPSAFAVFARCGGLPAPLRLPGDYAGLSAAAAPPGLAADATCWFSIRSRNLNYNPSVADWALAAAGNSVASAEYAEVMYGACPARSPSCSGRMCD